MPRPKKVKNVNFKPEVIYFKPRGVPLRYLEEIEITIEELESMRLANIENLSQIDAAKLMQVHQSTFQRILAKVNEKVTKALVYGKAIKIHGSEYQMPKKDGNGPINTNGFARGLNRKNFGYGAQGQCLCPKCGYEQIHNIAKPCNKINCPKCETLMTRK